MSERIDLAFMPCYVQKFERATAEWHPFAAGLYWLLLMRQWQVGYVPAELDAVARVLRLTEKELRPHWACLRSKFQEACLLGTRRDVLVNAKLDRVYAHQLSVYLATCERNRINGSKGGRPRKADGNPVGSESDTERVPAGDATGNRQETRVKPEKRKKKEELPSVVGSDDKSSGGGGSPPTLEGMDLTGPFGMCYAVLYLHHQNMGQPPPLYVEAKKHVKGGTKLLGLAQALGIETAADLVSFVWQTKQHGASFGWIFEQRAGLLRQMSEGVEWVQRRQSLAEASTKPGLASTIAENPFG